MQSMKDGPHTVANGEPFPRGKQRVTLHVANKRDNHLIHEANGALGLRLQTVELRLQTGEHRLQTVTVTRGKRSLNSSEALPGRNSYQVVISNFLVLLLAVVEFCRFQSFSLVEPSAYDLHVACAAIAIATASSRRGPTLLLVRGLPCTWEKGRHSARSQVPKNSAMRSYIDPFHGTLSTLQVSTSETSVAKRAQTWLGAGAR